MGYLDPKDPNMTWGLLDQSVPKGNLALELEEAFKVYLDLRVDQVLWGKLVSQVTKAILVIVGTKRPRERKMTRVRRAMHLLFLNMLSLWDPQHNLNSQHLTPPLTRINRITVHEQDDSHDQQQKPIFSLTASPSSPKRRS